MYSNVPLESVCEELKDPNTVSKELLIQAIQAYPKLASALLPVLHGSVISPVLQEVSVYEILNGSIPFNVKNLFIWQVSLYDVPHLL